MRRIPALLICTALIIAALGSVSPASAATWPIGAARVSVPTERVFGADRFATAAAIAAKSYPAWSGVTHVIVASGDDRSAADPLSSGSLCWAYDAPLLLTGRNSTPSSTRAALAAIVSANTTVTVHVVGGQVSVPAARIAELKRIVGGNGHVEQPWLNGDRYTTSSGIAARVREVAADASRTIPAAVFIANGARRSAFWDVLAVSAVSRNTGIPVLLTAGGSVPAATRSTLTSMPGTRRILIGGTEAVSAAVYQTVGGSARWSGATSHGTAASVARGAATEGWASPATFGVAVAMPDALAGAGLVGRAGGVLLLSDRVRISKPTWDLLSAPSDPLATGYLLGGAKVGSAALLSELNGAPALPALGSQTPASYGGSSARVAGSVGGNTTEVKLLINGVTKSTMSVLPWQKFDFGSVSVPKEGMQVAVVAGNPDGGSTSVSRSVKRLSYPYATCIIIDKSDFKLYWIKNNQLVKAYPIATGRAGMETPIGTWKILAKYKTDPSSVYGPRKMRMFRKVGNSYVFTAYAIHGTNQEWVIGTKASHGCIRMYNRQVLELFPQVPLGTMVVTRQ